MISRWNNTCNATSVTKPETQEQNLMQNGEASRSSSHIVGEEEGITMNAPVVAPSQPSLRVHKRHHYERSRSRTSSPCRKREPLMTQ